MTDAAQPPPSQPAAPTVSPLAALHVARRQMEFDAGEKLLLAGQVFELTQLTARQAAEIERLTAELAKHETPPAEPQEGKGGSI